MLTAKISTWFRGSLFFLSFGAREGKGSKETLGTRLHKSSSFGRGAVILTDEVKHKRSKTEKS